MPNYRKPKTDTFWDSAKRNKMAWVHYLDRLTELSISMFEWKNLPETVDERFLELTLFNDGFAVFFKDDDIGYLALRTMIGGQLNVYQIPIWRKAYASNGYNATLDENNSVIIFNNMIHTNSVIETSLYSERLWNIDRAIEINVNAQKTPILLLANDESEKLTLKNLYMQYDGNEPVIYGYKNLSANPITSINTGAPFVSSNLYELKTQIWNEALTYLGISNISFQKRERLVVDEVRRNQGGTIASRYSRLNARRQACEQINRMFGLNIECNFREDFQTIDEDDLSTLTEDGELEVEGDE